MKKLLFIAAVIPFIAAVATDEPQKDPAAESAEKSARVQAMADAFRPSVVNIRLRLKRLPSNWAFRVDSRVGIRFPFASVGMAFSVQPFSWQTRCQGTMLAWWSSSETITSSPGVRNCRP